MQTDHALPTPPSPPDRPSAPAPRSAGPELQRRQLGAGVFLCQQGAPPGPLYVILEGHVRVFHRAGPGAPVQPLAILGPGSIVGELAPLLKRPRSANVRTMTPVQALEVPLAQVGPLLRSHPRLRRVLTDGLRERAGLTEEAIADLALDHGFDEAAMTAEASAAVRDGERGPELAVPPYDRSFAYPRRVTCPACDKSFITLAIRPNAVRLADREADFHERFESTWNPYDYELWVCPGCLYAGFPDDFEELPPAQRGRVPAVVERVVREQWQGERPDFNGPRSVALRERALQLTLALYRARGVSFLRRGRVQQRLAWCARERGDDAAEARWLRCALEDYGLAYERERLPSAETEIHVQVVCGDVARRLGDGRAAVQWFTQAIGHPDIAQHPEMERLAREGWSLLRDKAA